MRIFSALALALVPLAAPASLAARAESDLLSITFSVAGQETTLVDINNNGQKFFEFTFGPLQATGRAKEDTVPGGGPKSVYLAGQPVGFPYAHFSNLTPETQEVSITLRGRSHGTPATGRARMKYKGSARDAVGTQNPVSVPAHGGEGWANDIVGPPDFTVTGPAIDLPSGEGSWEETAGLVDVAASRLALRWTFTLGPRDQIRLDRIVVGIDQLCGGTIPTGSTGGGTPIALRETRGEAPGGAPIPCALPASRTGDCGNYRWYNVCSGYIWIYPQWARGEGAGVLFGGGAQPCVTPGNRVEKAITYFRNVIPNYNLTVDVFLDRDDEGDGCPDGIIASDLDLDPGLRWNCSTLDACIPTEHVIVRTEHTGCVAPSFATDGPFSIVCDPYGIARSYFYDDDGTCLLWTGPTNRQDNFLYWLIVDGGGCPTATEATTWGHIKGLYH